MTAAEVADHLRVSKQTVYKWTNHLAMPVSRIGGVNRYDRSEVDVWAKRHEQRKTLNRHGLIA